MAPSIAHKFGMHETSVGQTHATKKEPWAAPTPSSQPDSDENVQNELCSIVKAEYSWLGDDETYRKRCVPGQYKPLIPI